MKEPDSDKRESKNAHPPFGVVLVLYLGGLLGGFLVALAGVEQLDGDWRLFGSALIGCGILLALTGSVLLLVL